MTDQEPQANRALARLLAQRYAQALRDADPVAAEEAIKVALQAGFDGAAICSRVIAPAMRWIGDLWERDSISVADEHLATAITHHLLGRLQASLFPPPHRTEAATALLACAEGEQHCRWNKSHGPPRGLSQTELAKRLGVTQKRVSAIERAQDLNLSTLQRYVDALGGRLQADVEFDDQTITLTPRRPRRQRKRVPA